jgi:hypothetical protein
MIRRAWRCAAPGPRPPEHLLASRVNEIDLVSLFGVCQIIPRAVEFQQEAIISLNAVE